MVSIICFLLSLSLNISHHIHLTYVIIDCAADPAIIRAVDEGIKTAQQLRSNHAFERPLIMISVNDDDDPHFRKAYFDPRQCPVHCLRPCEKVCPASAIKEAVGVIDDRCYGCGRCIAVCPYDKISALNYLVDSESIRGLFASGSVEAIEVHTQQGHLIKFKTLWDGIAKSVYENAKVVSVSFPDMGDSTLQYINAMYNIMRSSPSYSLFKGVHVWQTDGRPMSGDLGKGASYSSVQFAERLLSDLNRQDMSGAEDVISLNSGGHFLQLAGGTNDHSAALLRERGTLDGALGFGGIAFGGCARKSLSMLLHGLEEREPLLRIESHPIELNECVEFAEQLVASVKT